MSINIVPFEMAHFESYRAALGSVAREKRFLAFLDTPTVENTLAFVEQQLHQGMPHFIALTSENEVVGWCDISPLDRPVFSHVGTLGMGVIAPYRGQGIGERLISNALTKAQLKRLTRIELTVRETNFPAIRLYEKKGFHVEGLHRNAVRIDEKYENHVFMALLIEP